MDSLSLENSGCIPAQNGTVHLEKAVWAWHEPDPEGCHLLRREKRMQLLGEFWDVVEYFLSEGNSPSTWPEIPIVSSFYTASGQHLRHYD